MSDPTHVKHVKPATHAMPMTPMTHMTQTPVRFGPRQALVGMVTAPTQRVAAPVACLMFNMGANHRVGPRRINVKLAHALAARGVSSLRFDLGGIGDSDALDTAPDLQTRAVHSLQAAMDVLGEGLDVRRFVVAGMCSGVEHAMSAAAVDSRVVGLSLFDGFAFPQRRARWERTLRRALAVPTHPSFPGKAWRWVQRNLLQSEAAKAMPGFFADKRPAEANAEWFDATMQRLHARDVAMQLLYSGSLHVRDRDRDQLGAFRHAPFARSLDYEFLREVDHTVCTAEGQALFLQAVGDWVAECCFGAGLEPAHAPETELATEPLPHPQPQPQAQPGLAAEPEWRSAGRLAAGAARTLPAPAGQVGRAVTS